MAKDEMKHKCVLNQISHVILTLERKLSGKKMKIEPNARQKPS